MHHHAEAAHDGAWPRRHGDGAARLLRLAAAPTFAAMALLTSGGPHDLLCAPAATPLSGMAGMYLLMSLFHAGPWLRLEASREHTPKGEPR
jgi:hypothetical protein